MTHLLRLALLAASALLLAVNPAWAKKRAFAAAINNYNSIPHLQTALADSSEILKTLEKLGYEDVNLYKDLTLAQFNEAWAKFLGTVQNGDDVAFYFGGHGVQIDSINYLLPKDFPPAFQEVSMPDISINFQALMESLQSRGPHVALYILDACRNNPFQKPKGLARIESVFNTFVMYSAGANEVVADAPVKNSANSLYVFHLIPLLGKNDLPLVDVVKAVQIPVAKESENKQHPAYFDGVIGTCFLARVEECGVLTAENGIASDKVVRLGGFATWDNNCQGRPAPRIVVKSAPQFGHIFLRFEPFSVAAKHFGNSCDKRVLRGVGVYYLIDDPDRESNKVDKVQFAVKHWSVAPATTVDETFEIDLATRFSKRITTR